MAFRLVSDFKPAGDQPRAIEELVDGFQARRRSQVLLGVTGSGKSLAAEELVWVYRARPNGEPRPALIHIGSLVDQLFIANPDRVVHDGDHESLPLAGDPLWVPSLNPTTFKTEIKRVTAVTRHAAPAEMYRVTTKCGRAVVVTGDHNFFVLRSGRLQLVETSSLTSADHLPLPATLASPGLGQTELQSISPLEHMEGSRLYADAGPWLAALQQSLGKARLFDAMTAVGINNPALRAARAIQEHERLPIAKLACLADRLDAPLPESLRFGSKFDRLTLPVRLSVSDPLLRLLGFYVAEGHATKHFFMISAFEKEQQDQVVEALEAVGLKHFLRANGGDVGINSTTWSRLLRGLCGRVSREKRLPEFWPELSDEQLGKLLSAYFSSDGGIDGNAVTACTASRRLSTDLLYALRRLGIWARRRGAMKRATNSSAPAQKYWIISISGQENVERFNAKIGFCLERKATAIRPLIECEGNTNVDILPLSGGVLRELRRAVGLRQRDVVHDSGTGRIALSLVESGFRKPSRRAAARWLANLAKEARDGQLEQVRSLEILNQCQWSAVAEVEKIEPPSELVYDFTVEDNETFVGGDGIIVHNTYTMASTIERINRPALVISPNKVLAAQLYAEFKQFFPDNAVEYFISYYDYYQPEAYVPSTDTYIEKDASVNEHIDMLRLKATSSLLSRRDVIVVASVSCIYNIGSPDNYKELCLGVKVGSPIGRDELLSGLVATHYERSETEFTRGKFRVKGGAVDVFPAYGDTGLRVTLGDGVVESIVQFHPITGAVVAELEQAFIYPAKHFLTTRPELERALRTIDAELDERLKELDGKGKLLEAQRLAQRTRYDMEMLRELGFCHGVENYSRHLSGRPPGARPYCLLDYFPKDFALFIDESHVTVPQVRGMFEGDRVRKQTLVDFGFRLPSAMDNRPLRFEEFESLMGQTVFVSATPGPYELRASKGVVVEQVIRPTGLVDPEVLVHPTEGQIPHLIGLIQERAARKERVLVTTLTKRTAEDLTSYLAGKGLKVRYLHSDIDSLTRIEILKELRLGRFDVLVGINLLREGLDLPEVSLVAVLDAANEGFLRSETTLIQIAGRAARHLTGKVVFYADAVTGSMQRALGEMDRRRARQVEHNKLHGITPRGIQKAVQDLDEFQSKAKQEALQLVRGASAKPLTRKNLPHLVDSLEHQMREAADNLDFELAAALRDQIIELREMSGVKGGSRPKRESAPKPKRGARA